MRSEDEIPAIREALQAQIEDFNDKKSEMSDANNGELEGNPMFDNYEGYYKVQIGDHISYKYEILRILGKGSFA